MTVAALGVILSLLSLAVSATTLWLTVLRRGRLAMTTPSIIFFGFDDVPQPMPKVFLRMLLYSTAVKGQVVESMYVKLRHEGGLQRTFGFWGYDDGTKLVPGSGLHVSKAGVAAHHHFVRSVHEMPIIFDPGIYKIDVFARLAGRRKPVRLSTVTVDLSHANAHTLKGHEGVLFERLPDTGEYVGHPQERRNVPRPIPNLA